MGNHGFHRQVAHVHWVLQHQRLYFLVFHGLHHPIAGIEADVNDFSRQAGFLQGAQHADGAGFVDGKDSVHVFRIFQ